MEKPEKHLIGVVGDITTGPTTFFVVEQLKERLKTPIRATLDENIVKGVQMLMKWLATGLQY
jgi:hypothetical protein